MSYGRSALVARSQAGDPFLGGLLKGAIGIAGKILPGPIGMGARALSGVLGGGKPRAMPRAPGGRLPASFAGAWGGGPFSGVGRMGEQVMAGAQPRRRRRMNPGNSKAARRAARRLEGWHRELKKVEKVIRKIKGPAPRRARRDIPRGHTHVR